MQMPRDGFNQTVSVLLNSEIIINQAQFILRGLDEELTKEQNTLETILNGGVPARILSDMDVALDCVPHGTQDNIRVSQCFQSMGYIQCILDSFCLLYTSDAADE